MSGIYRILPAIPMMAAVILALTAGPVLAEKGGGPKQGHAARIVIAPDDRQTIGAYLVRDTRVNCPPGLAKKNPPCVPPGQAKKWRIGESLPDDVAFSLVTGDLLARLSPLPSGYRYVQVDRDVLLLREAGRMVVDAVTLAAAGD